MFTRGSAGRRPTGLRSAWGSLGQLIVTSHRFWLALALLGAIVPGTPAKVMAMPTQSDSATVAAEHPGVVKLAQAAPAGQAAPDANAPTAAADEPIGNVAALIGIATVIRNRNSLPLHARDDIFLNDVVQTSTSSTLDITFNDATTFHLSANAKITIDNYVYEDGGKQNSGIFDIAKGTVAFVAAAVAKTGDMKISTPTATLGIRGTSGLIEVPEGATAGGANDVNIKLYPDEDGHVGRIEVNDRSGARLGLLTQGASGFAIRLGAGGARPTALPLRISLQQAARDQGFVRQVHTAQNLGRQIVTEQRAARRANSPPNAPGRGNQAPGQRQNQLPGQNRPQQQNQNRQPQQGAPNRQGRQPSNLQPREGALPPRAPFVRGPGGNRPALLRPRLPALPKGKEDRRRR